MTPEVTHKLANLPDSPGVYMMRGADGTILYVGKAINLKHRVRSYFQSQKGHNAKVRALVEKICDIDILLCDTELEAFILECTLIKKHQPWYNILLKDSKHYPYIRIDTAQPYPRVEMVRDFGKDNAKYFGPYIGGTVVSEVMEAVRLVYPLRTCTRDLRRPSRPCIQHDIGQCLAPCTGTVSPDDYAEVVKHVLRFLGGHQDAVLEELRDQMNQASAALQFERAAIFRDRIAAVEKVSQRQKAISTGGEDQDVLSVASDGIDAIVQVLFVRGGKMIGGDPCVLERVGDAAPEELIATFLLQYYTQAQLVPPVILMPCMAQDGDAIAVYLTNLRGKKVTLTVPQRGEKRQLVELAERNAKDALEKRRDKMQRDHARTMGACAALGEALGLPEPPRRIEAFDISNTQGVEIVASMVVFEQGLAKKSDYRRFKVKTVEGGPNDFASMKEVVGRRFKRLMEGDTKFAARPDVVLVDGGPGQLSYALEAVKEIGLTDPPPFFGLAERFEEIWLPGAERPIRLDRSSDALHLIQRVRDEAHRFAITYHRSLRGKRSVRSRLTEIPGMGETRVKALLKAFPNMRAIEQADVEALRAVPGMNRVSAQAVWDFYHKSEAGEMDSKTDAQEGTETGA